MKRENLDIPTSIKSREYKIFKEEEKIKSRIKTFYGKLCNFSEKLVKISPSKKDREKIQKDIDFCHLNITPEGVMSTNVITAVVTLIILIIYSVISFSGFYEFKVGYASLIFVTGMFLTYYTITYLKNIRSIYEMESGSESVNMIIYMAMYMRNTPNLEKAIEFTSANLSGNLAYELRKMLWDVEVRNFTNIKDALLQYTDKWKQNRDLIEAVSLLISSTSQIGNKRIETLNRAVKIMIDGNRVNAKNFTNDLKTPVIVVHALGIVLPLLGFVMFPLISTFLNIGVIPLFVIYNMLLPMILYMVIRRINNKRPATYSKIDVTENPDLPKPGNFFIGKKQFKAKYVSISTFFTCIIISFLLFQITSVSDITSPYKIASAIFFVGAFSFSTAIYFYLTSFQVLKISKETKSIEREFGDILFQMGNSLSNGIPVESAMDICVQNTKNLKIRNLFARSLYNMRKLGFTFKQSFFHKNYGSLRYYPSKMIRSVMTSVVESSQRGSQAASVTMLSVSKYVKNLYITQDDVRNELNDPVSSMKLQAYFISPLISAIVVTLTILILKILSGISSQVSSLPYVPTFSILNEVNITTFSFLIVVGFYMFETVLVLSLFVNGIENGHDQAGFRSMVAKAIVVSTVSFVVVMVISLLIFLPLIDLTGIS